VELLYRPLSAGVRHVHVNMVDIDSRELVSSWLVTASAAVPVVTKTFDLDVPCGAAAHKKIAYTNQWDVPRLFLLRTSNPGALKLKDARLEVAGRGRGFIRLWFAPMDRCARAF
jgi:nephrocystin-4